MNGFYSEERPSRCARSSHSQDPLAPRLYARVRHRYAHPDVSGELIIVEEGSLYPALHRMEQSGWVRANWAVTEYGRKAKYYALTRTGKEQLADREKNWEEVAKGVQAILRFA